MTSSTTRQRYFGSSTQPLPGPDSFDPTRLNARIRRERHPTPARSTVEAGRKEVSTLRSGTAPAGRLKFIRVEAILRRCDKVFDMVGNPVGSEEVRVLGTRCILFHDVKGEAA